jgi:hypothetical protein
MLKGAAEPYESEKKRLEGLRSDYVVAQRRARERAEREAQEAAVRAQRAREAEQRRVAEAAGVPEEQLPEPEPVPEVKLGHSATVETAQGKVTERFRWVPTVTDPSQVPVSLMVPDMVAIRREVQAVVKDVEEGRTTDEVEAILAAAFPGIKCELVASSTARGW